MPATVYAFTGRPCNIRYCVADLFPNDVRPRVITTAFALLFPIGSAAQAVTATLTARVSQNASPVEAATVRSGSVGSLTDARGLALLRLPLGAHTVIAARIGFAPETLSVTLTADTTVDFTLEAFGAELGAVVINATRAERRIEEEAIRVEVIGREEIEEKLLMTPGDISMMLNETSGLRVQTTSPSLGGANVRVQGLRGRYTLLLSDGLPLYGGQTGALGLLQIPPMDLGQVEIIKGAASALYGSSALGGVINLVSRRPVKTRELLLNQTSKNGTDVVAYLSDSITAQSGYSALLGLHRQQAFDIDDDGWADLAGYNRLVARPRFFWSDNRGTMAFATAGLTVEDRTGGTLEDAVTPEGTPFREGLKTSRGDAGFVVRRLAGTWLTSARASISAQRHRHQFGEIVEGDLHGTVFGEATATRTGVHHTLTTGLAFQRDTYRGRDVSGFDFSYNQPALFIADDFAITRWLRVSASGRVDFHSEYGSILTPRVSALVTRGSWTVRGSAGGGAFAPTPFIEETEATGLTPVVPAQKLEVEKARGATLDVGRVIGTVELNATAFASMISDPVVVHERDDGRLELTNADGDTRTGGAELLARVRREPFTVTTTYTYLRSTEEDLTSRARRRVPLTPAHAIGMVAMWEQEGQGRVGLEMYFTGKQQLEDNPFRSQAPSYLIIGALMERVVGPARLFINLENIGDVRPTRYHPVLLPARGAGGRWTTDVWSPVEGRTINGGLRLTFPRAEEP